jgi:hypothetical protein
MAVIVVVNHNKLECSQLTYSSALVLWPLLGLHSNGRQQALPANIRLRWNSIAVANTLAYYNKTTVTAVKSFVKQAPDAVIL